MLEWGPALRTWALLEPPEAGRSLRAERLADHRLDYLDYEGPISRDRGSVTQWDAGDFLLLEETAERLEVQLAGKKLSGRLVLLHQPTMSAAQAHAPSEGQFWTFSFERK